jgi:hypothetical protein
MDWQPHDPGQQDAVPALMRNAHDEPGVLVHPEGMSTDLCCIDDGDDWSYQFLLSVTIPAPLTLASLPRPIRSLGGNGIAGNGAMAILRETTQAANTLLGQLYAFVVASNPKTHEG